MSVDKHLNPTLINSDIISRCEHDIFLFMQLQHLTENPVKLSLITDNLSVSRIHQIIKVYLQLWRLIMGANISSSEPTTDPVIELDFNEFEYAQIHKYELDIQQQLWIWRTNLLYQIIIIAINMMSNQKLFNQVYSTTDKVIAPVYRKEMSKFLNEYNLFIFGSIKPTSDLDVSIHYAGTMNLHGINYIIQIIEDLFIILLNVPCLKLDIEFYSDMITMNEPDTNEYIFYLDTMTFPMSYLQTMLPYVGFSILRNYIFGVLESSDASMASSIKESSDASIASSIKESSDASIASSIKIKDSQIKDISNTIETKSRRSSSSSISATSIIEDGSIIDLIKQFDFNHAYKYLSKRGGSAQITKLPRLPALSSYSDSSKIELIRKIKNINKDLIPAHLLSDSNWQNKAKQLAIQYFSQDYDELRHKYYRYLEIAEIAVYKLQKIIKERLDAHKFNKIENLNAIILDTMIKISQADVYRTENYVCSPTVMHVVKILQSNKEQGTDISKYDCNYPKKFAICGIGKVGYIISMLEQCGYLLRYNISHCLDKSLCERKQAKYYHRLHHAIQLYRELA